MDNKAARHTFNLHVATHIEDLQKALQQLISKRSKYNPFQDISFVVQSQPMQRYLQIFFAKTFQTASGLKFYYPKAFLKTLSSFLSPKLAHEYKDETTSMPGAQKNMAYDRRYLFFICLEFLLSAVEARDSSPSPNKQHTGSRLAAFEFKKNELAWLSSYLQYFAMPQQALSKQRLIDLAWQLADLYEQYIFYRPAWLQDFEGLRPFEYQDSAKAISKEQLHKTAQAIAWQKIRKFLKADHYNETQQQLLSLLYNNTRPASHLNLSPLGSQLLKERISKLQAAWPQIIVFGVSYLPPLYLHALKALSNIIPLHYFLLNPSFLLPLDTKNFLLRELGQGFKDQQQVFSNIFAGSQELRLIKLDKVLRASQEEHSAKEKKNIQKTKREPTLLKILQQSLRHDGDLTSKSNQENFFSSLSNKGAALQDSLKKLYKQACQEYSQASSNSPHASTPHSPPPSKAKIADMNASTSTSASAAGSALEKLRYSFSLRLCSSRLREVETLHDLLLGILTTKPSPSNIQSSHIQPSDVLVMANNYDSYKPLIKKIFTARKKIPFSLWYGESYQEEHASEQEFFLLLNMLETSTAEDNQEELSEENIQSIFSMQAPLRSFGILDEDRQSLQAFLSRRIQPLKKPYQFLLQAFATRPVTLNSQDSHGSQAAEFLTDSWEDDEDEALMLLFGKFLHFWRRFQQLKVEFKKPALLSTWISRLFEFAKSFFSSMPAESSPLYFLTDLKENLEPLFRNSKSHELSSSTMFIALQKFFESRSIRQGGYLSGGISFSPLVPMRSLPFKLIVLLGMEAETYPGEEIPHSFNLMLDKPDPGDRRRQRDNEMLFLEILLATKEQLIISWIDPPFFSEKERQTQPSPPSPVILSCLNLLTALIGDAPAPANPANASGKLAERVASQALVPPALPADGFSLLQLLSYEEYKEGFNPLEFLSASKLPPSLEEQSQKTNSPHGLVLAEKLSQKAFHRPYYKTAQLMHLLQVSQEAGKQNPPGHKTAHQQAAPLSASPAHPLEPETLVDSFHKEQAFRSSVKGEGVPKLSLEELSYFFSNPPRFYFKEVLGMAQPQDFSHAKPDDFGVDSFLLASYRSKRLAQCSLETFLQYPKLQKNEKTWLQKYKDFPNSILGQQAFQKLDSDFLKIWEPALALLNKKLALGMPLYQELSSKAASSQPSKTESHFVAKTESHLSSKLASKTIATTLSLRLSSFLPELLPPLQEASTDIQLQASIPSLLQQNKENKEANEATFLLLHVHSSPLKLAVLFRFYLEALCCFLLEPNVSEAFLVSQGIKENNFFGMSSTHPLAKKGCLLRMSSEEFPPQRAAATLAKFIFYFQSGQRQALPLFENASMAFWGECFKIHNEDPKKKPKDPDPFAALTKAKKIFGEERSLAADNRQAFYTRLFPSAKNLFSNSGFFQHVNQDLLLPMAEEITPYDPY